MSLPVLNDQKVDIYIEKRGRHILRGIENHAFES